MRKIIPVMTAAILLATSAPVMAGGLTAFFRHVNRGYHRNHCWPQPFAYQDALATKAPFAVMVQNGWRLQNIIGNHHYLPGTATLNEAGQRQIQWIVTQAPVNRRTIFVERTNSRVQTEGRLAAVRYIAQQFAADGTGVDVRETHLVARGMSGAYADHVNTQFGESAPAPRIPGASAGLGGT